MKQELRDAVVEALCIDPTINMVVDNEPYPIGQVRDIQPVSLGAFKVSFQLEDRSTNEVEDGSAMVVFADVGDGERVPIMWKELD